MRSRRTYVGKHVGCVDVGRLVKRRIGWQTQAPQQPGLGLRQLELCLCRLHAKIGVIFVGPAKDTPPACEGQQSALLQKPKNAH
jgi:hypothetical protein